MRPSRGSLLQTVAVSAATILGTGILGLPVSLHATGLWPFLVLFSLTCIAQIGVVVATAELLMRAYALARSGELAPHGYMTLEENCDVPESASAGRGDSPSLHSLSSLFLPHWSLRVMFEGMVMLHFVSIMSSYSLAAPQAYTQLIPVLASLSPAIGQIVFTTVASLTVVLLLPFVLPALTAATLAKGGIISFIIFMTMVEGLAIRQPIVNAWLPPQVLVEPLLMGTIALSGVVNLMPVTFQACLNSCKATGSASTPVDRDFIVAYRGATVLAVVLCYFLNIAWSIAVLLCVPQIGATSEAVTNTRSVVSAISHAVISRHPGHHHADTIAHATGVANATLTAANEMGEISTVPLIQVLHSRGGAFNGAIAFFVNLFIAVSVTVSFFVMATGMVNYLDGLVSSVTMGYALDSRKPGLLRATNYVFWFGTVLLIAVLNPAGFVKILEGVTSFSLNFEAGVFIMVMFVVSRNREEFEDGFLVHLSASLPSSFAIALVVIVGSYFAGAVLIDAIFFLPKAFG